MGLKDSLQQILSRLGGANPAGPVGFNNDPAKHAGHGDLAVDPIQLSVLEAKLGYTFRDRSLLINALLHRSHIHVTGQDREQSNERLEFLGDAVLGLVVNERLYHKFPERSEGDLTKMKSLLVCGVRLSEVAVNFDLGVHIRMSRSEAATGGRQRSSILADTTEALIGAVYLDGGLAPAAGMIERVVLSGSDKILARRSLRNYKSRLQEMIQARFKTPPRYKVLEVSGPDHDRLFKVSVFINGIAMGEGEGRNKKTAEQSAAREALQHIENDPKLLDDTEG
jgi:ribonuclease III